MEDSRGGEYRASFSMEALKEPHCRILFIHPGVCMDDSNKIKLFYFTIKIAYVSKKSEMRGS